MLSDLLRVTSKKTPEAVAITFGQHTYTYREADNLGSRLARSLTDLGITKGSRLGLYLYNCPEMVVCYHACFKIGATVVPMGANLKARGLHFRLDHSRPAVLITQRQLLPEMTRAVRQRSGVHHVYLIDWQPVDADFARPLDELLEACEGASDFPNVTPETTAVIFFGDDGKS